MAQRIRTFSNDEVLVRQRRDHIAECAVKLFFDKGYEATTMRELAKACGMAQGALYHYIGSKPDILHLICVNSSSGSGGLIRLLNQLGNVTKTEALRRCLREYLSWYESEHQQLLITFFNREIQNFSREDRRMLLKSQISIQEFFEKLLVEGIKAREFVIDDPVLLAHNILMLGQDWVLRRWFLAPKYTIAEYMEKQTQAILELISKDRSQATKKAGRRAALRT